MTDIIAIAGLASSLVALLGVVVFLGVYKERIDTHDRWLRLILENWVMNAQTTGKVRGNSPLVPSPEFLTQVSPDLKQICQEIAAQSKITDDCVVLGNRLLRTLNGHMVLDATEQLVTAEGPLHQDFAALLVYIRSLIRDAGPKKTRHRQATPVAGGKERNLSAG